MKLLLYEYCGFNSDAAVVPFAKLMRPDGGADSEGWEGKGQGWRLWALP